MIKVSVKKFFTSLTLIICSSLVSCRISKGELTICANCLESYAEAVCSQFEEKTGIKTSLKMISVNQALELEKNGNSTADVWFGGTQYPYIEASSLGLLYPYKAKNASHLIDKKYMDENYMWYGIYLGVLGFFWNQDELDKRNIMPPVDWDDLLKPEYKGLITFGNPKTCGTGKLIVNTVVQIRGKDEAMKYFKELDKNIFNYTVYGVQPAYMVADNEAIIGIGFMHDILRKMITENKEYLGMTTPISGTSCEIGATAIVKSAKNIENAKKFIEFALSPECVNLAHENNSYQMVLIDNAEPVKTAINTGLDKIETIDFDYEDATKNGESYCDEFIKTIRNDNRVHYK